MESLDFSHKVADTLRDLIHRLPDQVYANSDYIIRGKKLRSNLMHRVALAIGCPPEKVVVPASVLELIHTTTILHDDIIDQTDERRGDRTIHSLHKKKVSVFSADYLLSLSLGKLSQEVPSALQQIFFDKIQEVCRGEIHQDLHTDIEKPLSLKECVRIAREKTGALFALSFLTPPMVMEMEEPKVRFLEKAGYAYGTVYQLLDDFKDILFDTRTRDNMDSSFKHWTISSVLWNQIDPGSFRLFTQDVESGLPPAIQDKVWLSLAREINQLLSELKAEMREASDFSQEKERVYQIVKEEIAEFSPAELSF